MKHIADGVWPTMITPFTGAGQIDYAAVERLIEWYIDRGAHGIFAVCQSSEMFYLSLEERVKLAKETVRMVAGRVPVIASGHISDEIDAQRRELATMADTGIDSLVLVSNRFAQAADDDDEAAWKRRFETVTEAVPEEMPLGFYECPYPFKYVFSLPLLEWLEQTGRVTFLKDTCCDSAMIRRRAERFSGSALKLYNANSATLLSSLQWGYAGYCGVMANFQTDLYSWLFSHRDVGGEAKRVARLADYLGFSSSLESRGYPVNAKYFLSVDGVDMTTASRVSQTGLSETIRLELEQFHRHNSDVARGFTNR